MGEPSDTPAEALLPKPVDPPAEEPPTGDWYVKLTRRRDQRKYFLHRNGQTTARCDHIMLLPEEIAKQLAEALRKNHPDFTAVAKKCPKRFLSPQRGRKPKRKPVSTHSMEDAGCLRDCPFCGGRAYLSETCDDRGRWYSVRCEGCNAQSEERPTRESAIGRWNRRAKPDNTKHEQKGQEKCQSTSATSATTPSGSASGPSPASASR